MALRAKGVVALAALLAVCALPELVRAAAFEQEGGAPRERLPPRHGRLLRQADTSQLPEIALEEESPAPEDDSSADGFDVTPTPDNAATTDVATVPEGDTTADGTSAGGANASVDAVLEEEASSNSTDTGVPACQPLTLTGTLTTPEAVAQLFDCMDADGNGIVSFGEACAAALPGCAAAVEEGDDLLLAELHSTFDALDADGNSELSLAELAPLLTAVGVPAGATSPSAAPTPAQAASPTVASAHSPAAAPASTPTTASVPVTIASTSSADARMLAWGVGAAVLLALLHVAL
eukprot:scaffold9.g3079.t1